MLSCPMCKKSLPSLGKECPSCKADVSLLVTYVEGLDGSLERAEAYTRAGELAEAMWAYLEILEMDPDNATARRQVGRVAAAVRQFDQLAQGRRWLDRIQTRARFRQWVNSWGTEGTLPKPVVWTMAIVLLLGALLLGYALGRGVPRQHPADGAAQSSTEQQ